MVRIGEAGEGLDTVSDRRLIVHSIYWDAKKTLAQGRKVPVALACEHVILNDVFEAVVALGLPCEPQARGWWRTRACGLALRCRR